MKKFVPLLLLLLLIAPPLFSQKNDCKKFHLYGECRQYSGPGFRYDGQSRSNVIGYGDQMIYSLVLYGNCQYKIYFCTSEAFKPVHFQLLNGESNEVFYDNSSDDYIDNLTLNIEKTQRLKIRVEVKAEGMSEEDKLEFFGCLGMLIESRKDKKR